ncbi:MAG TPA: bifunctional precorrin-2 dehydrogenase/sirohydrochlorin ferrochelatase [Methanoregulaceae archaeon]|nr:bifunctional precorrin-2 dehydrogenase/sirohydrochlorin ferrochelatase [Methanoregulaceae archaeon]HPW09602.1 bifunctional precorrin-2 dehydrogenase/sirohydrochlorin ferrochelatase [Methanoregulaceae archaeon]HQM56154.1 bifunctional precorrin-2 dehydrogenase/sirohydrochlorin ferrochelatase [Methanoregulaceae archaeon]
MRPLMIDLTGKKVVIIGGGEVGARKARFFAPAAEVTVISRSFSPHLSGIDVKRIPCDIRDLPDGKIRALLDGAFAVVAATPDPSLNNRIGTLCREKGILFNNASGDTGDLLIPSVIAGDHFLLALSTEGESPAVSRFLREHLQSTLPELDRMVTLQGRLRKYLLDIEPDSRKRKDIVIKVLHDPSVWVALAKSEEGAWQIIEEKYLQ